jgi:hypothetical protein
MPPKLSTRQTAVYITPAQNVFNSAIPHFGNSAIHTTVHGHPILYFKLRCTQNRLQLWPPPKSRMDSLRASPRTSASVFHDAGWIVKGKLTVVAAAVIVVDAMLLSVLVGFAIELRAFLLGRFAEIPGLGTMAASLVFLIAAGIAYADFKPLTRAWPAIKDIYVWSFVTVAAFLLGHIIFLLYQNRDRTAALVLRQPLPASSSD